MVAQTTHAACVPSQIRPFSLRRDLADLADLVQVAFGEELAATGSHMVEEMRQMAALGPLMHLVYLGTTPLRGFVWVHNGRVVGNVSLARDRGHRWVLSNVAVLPEMRGQGIAGRLVDMAIEHILERGGRQVTLQVLSTNTPAHALYAHRGFSRYDTIHELQLRHERWPAALRMSHPWVKPVRKDDTSWLPGLVQSSVPPGARPFQQADASPRVGPWKRLFGELGALLLSQDTIRLAAVVEGQPVGVASATLRLLAAWSEVELHVAPTHRGAVEAPLMEALLAQLDASPRRNLRATVSETHREALAALHHLGFETQRVLDQMGRTL